MLTKRPFIVSIQLQSYRQFKYLENAVPIIIELKKILLQHVEINYNVLLWHNIHKSVS